MESLGDQAVEDVPAEGGLSVGGPAHGLHEFGRWGVLDEEAAGSGREHRIQMVVVVERGEGDDPGGRACGQDAAGGRDAVHAGHSQVHEDDVGSQVFRQSYRLRAVVRLAQDLDVLRLLEEHAQSHTDELLVVDDEDADHSWGSMSGAKAGSSAVSRQP